VWRARIVLLSAAGVGTMAIQRQTGKGKPTIWRWQARFMAEGVEGLLHEATRPPGQAAADGGGDRAGGRDDVGGKRTQTAPSETILAANIM